MMKNIKKYYEINFNNSLKTEHEHRKHLVVTRWYVNPYGKKHNGVVHTVFNQYNFNYVSDLKIWCL